MLSTRNQPVPEGEGAQHCSDSTAYRERWYRQECHQEDYANTPSKQIYSRNLKGRKGSTQLTS